MRTLRSRVKITTAALIMGASIGVSAMGCGGGTGGGQQSSTTTTTPQSSSSVPAPTEKSINPTGGNLFTPPVVAPPAPTVLPGEHPGINGVP